MEFHCGNWVCAELKFCRDVEFCVDQDAVSSISRVLCKREEMQKIVFCYIAICHQYSAGVKHSTVAHTTSRSCLYALRFNPTIMLIEIAV